MLVVHPQLCGDHSPFETYNMNTAPVVNAVANTEDDHWHLELEKTVDDDNGSYVCTAKNVLRDVKQEPTSCFLKFTVQMYVKESKDAQDFTRVKNVFARHNRRRYLNDGEILVKHKQLSVSNTQKFDGSLEYIRVTM